MLDPTAVAQVFGSELRAARVRAGLTQLGLAERCGLDRTYISLLERGLRQPSITTVLQVAEAIGIEPTRLIDQTWKRLIESR